MINGIPLSNNIYINRIQKQNNACDAVSLSQNTQSNSVQNPLFYNTNFSTVLTQSDIQKYNFLLNYASDIQLSQNSDNMTAAQQLNFLLKTGKLLNKSSNDSSSTLDNLYDIATQKRAYNLDGKLIFSNVLDILCNPRFVTQNFGNTPEYYEKKILDAYGTGSKIKSNPDLIQVNESGVCPAASIEVNIADKYPAEYARWISKLSSEDKKIDLNCSTNVLSESNPLETISIIDLFQTKKTGFDWNKLKLEVSADENAYIRAEIQSKDWDYGERNVADTLFQSAVMQIGSQNTYNSLTDTHNSEFNSSDKGLIEIEKTYVESLIKNKNITSIIYQNIDDNKNLVGYNCSFDMIAKHLKKTIDSGDDAIIGIVLTNESAGITKDPNYSPKLDGAPNQIINGHEITVTGYRVEPNGKTTFICVDTDDDNPNFVEYSEDWLLPKIHHGGYATEIVRDDLDKFDYMK